MTHHCRQFRRDGLVRHRIFDVSSMMVTYFLGRWSPGRGPQETAVTPATGGTVGTAASGGPFALSPSQSLLHVDPSKSIEMNDGHKGVAWCLSVCLFLTRTRVSLFPPLIVGLRRLNPTFPYLPRRSTAWGSEEITGRVRRPRPGRQVRQRHRDRRPSDSALISSFPHSLIP